MQTDKSNSMRNGESDSGVIGRRGFLSQLAALAAVTAVENKQSADAAEPSQPASPLPTIQIGKHRISRLVAGSNPILGYSYAGQHADRHMKDYYTPERTVEFLQNCERAGITTHQFADPDRALPYVRPLRERGSKMSFFCLLPECDGGASAWPVDRLYRELGRNLAIPASRAEEAVRLLAAEGAVELLPADGICVLRRDQIAAVVQKLEAAAANPPPS